jgi:hypothetical protein
MMYIKKRLIPFMLLLCLICLAGCGNGAAEPAPSPGRQNPAVAPPALTEPNGGTEPGRGALTRQDEDGLVSVRIEDGRAEISFDLERWEKLHDLYDVGEFYEPAMIREGPFAIGNLAGGVKDACIGKIDALDWINYKFVTPAVVLLMEDGSLEWLLADPYPGDYEWEYYSNGKLPWLKDIVSLSYENETAGRGDPVIFATDKDGLRYDVRALCWLTHVFEAEWVYEIGPTLEDDRECIFLNFQADGEISARKGLLYNGDCYAFYTGKYTVSLAENDTAGRRPAIISLELWDEWQLDMPNPDFSAPPELSGTYFFEADGI